MASCVRPTKTEILDAELCNDILAAYDKQCREQHAETKAREQASSRAWLLCGCGRVRK